MPEKKCQSCKTCSPNATRSYDCTAQGGNTADVTCKCYAGFYGDGYSVGQPCRACKKCHPNATRNLSTPPCTAENPPVQDVNCTCNIDFYDVNGDGVTCLQCKVCSLNATQSNRCYGNTSTDTSSCCCNQGFEGSGVTCTACNSGFYKNEAACEQSPLLHPSPMFFETVCSLSSV